MSWLKNVLITRLFGNILGPVAEWLNGKKTAIGAVSLLLWTFLYVVPVLYPAAAGIIPLVESIRSALEGAGVQLDGELLATGTSFTIVGLADKIRKYIKGDK